MSAYIVVVEESGKPPVFLAERKGKRAPGKLSREYPDAFVFGTQEGANAYARLLRAVVYEVGGYERGGGPVGNFS